MIKYRIEYDQRGLLKITRSSAKSFRGGKWFRILVFDFMCKSESRKPTYGNISLLSVGEELQEKMVF